MKTITLTDEQAAFLGYCFDSLDNEWGNAGCNDLPDEIAAQFKNGDEIAEEYARLNDPVSENPEGPEWPLPDFCLLFWLRKKMDV